MSPVLPFNVGEVLELRSGVLKAQCAPQDNINCWTWPYSEPHSLTISAPSSKSFLPPVVILSMPSELGACDDLLLDLSSSSGSGGREWQSLSFHVTLLSSPTTLPSSSSSLQQYLSNLTSRPSAKTITSLISTPILIPYQVLLEGSVSTLEVRLCNFLSSCGKRSKTFVVSSSSNLPVVSLYSQNVIRMFRNTSLSISGGGYVSGCGIRDEERAAMQSSAYLKYRWSLWKDGVLQDSASLQSVSVNPMQFLLPSYRLKSESLYVVKLTVQHLVSMKSSSNSVQVFVRTGDVVCVLSSFSSSSIASPFSLVSSTGSGLGLRVEEWLLLDWSSSYDEYPVGDSDEDANELLFDWSCFKISPSYRASCDGSLVIAPSSSSFFQSVIGTDSPSSLAQILLTTNSSSAAIGDVFQIVVRATSLRSPLEVRSCEKFIQIHILATLSPVVSLQSLSGSKINPSSKLKILGKVDMGSSGVVQWSVNDDSIVLSSFSLSPLSLTLPSSPINSSHHVVSLVIASRSLPQQSSFLFTLSCSLVNGYTSSSSVVITTNSPPFGGVLEVNPVAGVMLQTFFSMLAPGWVDEDLPLSYQFGYLSTHISPIVLRSKLQLSHFSSLLPSGPANTQESVSNLTCLVLVFDQLDSPSTETFDVIVEEEKKSSNELRVFLLSGINSSQVSSNSDNLKNTLSLTSTILNRVNCSNAPDCFSLNRMGCSTTEGTCGECLHGFVGLLGSSNTPCASGEVWRSLQSKELLSERHCKSDAICDAFGLFLKCNPQTHFCQSLQKTCPNSCSGQGRCVFSSKYDLDKTVDECGLLDGSCVSRCECEDGFLGSSCSLRQDEFESQVDLRHLILESVQNLTRMENAESHNLKSWMVALSSTSPSDYLGLREDSKILMSSLAIDILRASAELGLSIEELRESGMDDVLDMCVSGLSSSLAATEGDNLVDPRQSILMSLLSSYSDFVTSDFLKGQYPVSSVNPYLRSSSFYFSSSIAPLSSLSFALPRTDLESVDGFTQPVISLPAYSSDLRILISEILVVASSTSGSSSLNVSRRLNTDSNVLVTQLSLPIFVSLRSSASCSSEDCVMRVMLPHKLTSTHVMNPINATNVSPYFEADCVVGEVKDHMFLCPHGEELVISCNGSVSGRGRRQCPSRSSFTLCDTRVQFQSSSSTSANSVADSQELFCVFSSFESNESVTTCLCNLSTLTRSMTELSGSVSFTLLSIEKSVVKDFVSTWESLSSLSTSEVLESWDVLVTTTSFVGIFSCFILLSLYLDLHEKRKLESLNNSQKILSRKSSLSVGKKSAAKRIASQRFVGVPQSLAASQQRAHLYETINFIESSLPAVFKSDSLWLKFKEEMKVYHRWLGIVFYYSPEFPRAMRVLSLFSGIVIMLFIQSVTYNIADPDDGSCEKCNDESCCLSISSTLNSNEERCYWSLEVSDTLNISSLDQGSCHFRKINDDPVRIFIVAMVSAIVSAPFALSLQYVIESVLAKEILTEADQRNRNLARQNSLRRRITVQPDTVDELNGGKSFQEDRDLMLRDWKNYHQHLLDTNLSQAEEFVKVWGPLGEHVCQETQSHWSFPLLTSFLERVLGLNSLERYDHRQLMKEFLEVRHEVSREYVWLATVRKEVERGSESVGEQQDQDLLRLRRQRLIYLFVKDLSTGVMGDVLTNKVKRDSSSMTMFRLKDRVPLEWVVCGWVFVFLLNFGMLFYVYLFAMTQAPSRQSAWFQSFVIWLVFEIFVSSTGLVMVIQLFIPLYVFTEMSEIKTKVFKDLTAFRAKYHPSAVLRAGRDPAVVDEKCREESDHHPQFNAAKYLFTSWRVAALCPDLPESELILRFSTPWPKKKFGSREAEVSSYYDQTVLLNALSRIVIYFLTSFLHFHTLLQEIIVQMFCDSGMGYLGLLMIRLYRVHYLLPLAVMLALMLCLHFLVTSSTTFSDHAGKKKKIQDSSNQPTPEATQQISSPSTSWTSTSVRLKTIYDFLYTEDHSSSGPVGEPLHCPLSSLDRPAAPAAAVDLTEAIPELNREYSMDKEIDWEEDSIDSDSDSLGEVLWESLSSSSMSSSSGSTHSSVSSLPV